MNDKYPFQIRCPECDYFDNNIYYSPVCEFIDWECSECGHEITWVGYDGTSSLKEITLNNSKCKKSVKTTGFNNNIPPVNNIPPEEN